MMIFKNLSIRIKLILLFLGVSLLTLSLCSGIFLYNDMKIVKGIMIRNLTVLAGSVGNSGVGSLVFKDPVSAGKILSSLKEEYQVQFGVLYDAEGAMLAFYKRGEDVVVHPPALKTEGHLILETGRHKGDMEVVKSISHEGEIVGTIHLHARMSEWEAHLKNYAALMGAVIIFTLIVIFLVSFRLQKIISGPILSLARETKDIPGKRNYTLKADYQGKDELGTLYSGFREMLEQIGKREKDLIHMSRKLVESQEEERKRIAAELHDGLGQNLTAIRNGIKRYLRSLERQDRETRDLDEIADLALRSLEETREISFNLRPYLLDQIGLKAAVEAAIERAGRFSGITFTHDIQDLAGTFSTEAETHLYRIVQEGLTNIVKHSGAMEAGVCMKKEENFISVHIRDNGKGIAAPEGTMQKSDGLGLRGMAERARMLGGDLTIDSGPGKGTRLTIRIARENEKGQTREY